MSLKMLTHGEKLTLKEIHDFEAENKVNFPDDYKKFLLKYNGGNLEDNFFKFKCDNNENSSNIAVFFNLNQVLSNKNLLNYRLPNSVWPIADDDCGNLICIDLDMNTKGIYFWDHELEADDEKLPSRINLFFLAKNFFDFFTKQLKKGSEIIVSQKDLDEMEVVWIDPKFLEEQRKAGNLIEDDQKNSE